MVNTISWRVESDISTTSTLSIVYVLDVLYIQVGRSESSRNKASKGSPPTLYSPVPQHVISRGVDGRLPIDSSATILMMRDA